MDLVEYPFVICHHTTGMGTNEITEREGQRLQEQMGGWRKKRQSNQNSTKQRVGQQ